jgi:hypothetical protein
MLCRRVAGDVYNDRVTTLGMTFAAIAAWLAAAQAPAAPAAAAKVLPPVFSVVPGGNGSPLSAAPRRGKPQLVWTGFQVTESGSRVFVQTTTEVELKVANAKGGVTVTLHNCRVHMRNNSRMLDTRFFASPVERIAVHQRRRDIQLDIALRAPAQSTPRQEAGPGGTHFWVIDFVTTDKVATGG